MFNPQPDQCLDMDGNAGDVEDAGDAGDADGPQGNPVAQYDLMPVNPVPNIPGPAEQAGPSHANEGQCDGQAGPALPDLELQALSVNPPEVIPPIPPADQLYEEPNRLAVRIEMFEPIHVEPPRDMPIVEMIEDVAPAERPRILGPVEQHESEEDVVMNESIEDELALSSEDNNTNEPSSNTSDEDDLPLIPYFIPGNGSSLEYISNANVVPQRERPIEPVARQIEGPPPPSRPILIPPRPRARQLEEWDSDEDSPPPVMEPPRPKRRRRSNRPH